MNEPKILSYPLPLNRENRQDLIPVHFDQYNYMYAVKI